MYVMFPDSSAMGEARVKNTALEDEPHVGISGDAIPKMSTFEDLLELVGTCGRWNIFMFCMCSIG